MLNNLRNWVFVPFASFLSASITNGMAFADGYTCTFTTTCYEDSGCKDSNLTIRIIEDGHNQPQMITPGLAFQATKQVDELPRIVEGTVSYVSRLERNTVHLLTIFPNGSARFISVPPDGVNSAGSAG